MLIYTRECNLMYLMTSPTIPYHLPSDAPRLARLEDGIEDESISKLRVSLHLHSNRRTAS